MGQTIIEKILAHNTGKDVKPGDIVTVNVDRVMLDDIMIPFIVDKFHEMGFAKVWDPDKVVLIYDHPWNCDQDDNTGLYPQVIAEAVSVSPLSNGNFCTLTSVGVI